MSRWKVSEVEQMDDRGLDLPIEAITALCRRYQVRELSIFGSALGHDFNDQSDLDFLVEFEPGTRRGYLTFCRMQRELQEIVHREVDLVSKNGLKPKIRQAVLATARILYAS